MAEITRFFREVFSGCCGCCCSFAALH